MFNYSHNFDASSWNIKAYDSLSTDRLCPIEKHKLLIDCLLLNEIYLLLWANDLYVIWAESKICGQIEKEAWFTDPMCIAKHMQWWDSETYN